MKTLTKLSKSELTQLINQLEIGIKDMIDSNTDTNEIIRVNILIGNCIDLLNN